MHAAPPAVHRAGDLLGVLERASRVDGPARLFASRRTGAEGLVPHGRAPCDALLDQLLGGLAVEEARSGNQPRAIRLTVELLR